MPDKRQPDGPTDSSLNTASTLIAQREATVKECFTVAGGNTAAAFGPGAIDTAGISEDLNEWLDDTGQSAEAVLRMEQIRQRFWNTFRRLMAFATDYTKLRILHALIEHRLGVTYDTLAEYVDVSMRTVKKHVRSLVELDVVEREGNPAQVRFVDEERYLLAVDAAVYSE